MKTLNNTFPSRNSLPTPQKTLFQQKQWFWGLNQSTQELQNDILIAQKLHCNVVILGETGSGKELVAQMIHEGFKHHTQKSEVLCPFIPVNCGAIPEALAESILFGHERGAFTSARNRQYGKFESAREGTLFLDEIQNISLPIQAKLLRVLQQKEVDRLGSSKSTPISCRVITASNVPLELLVEEKKFRKDLFYRINVYPIYIPPLRERKEDLPILIKGILNNIQKHQKTSCLDVSDEAYEIIFQYDWPGNVRELEHALVYASIRSEGAPLKANDLPAQVNGKLARYVEKGSWQI